MSKLIWPVFIFVAAVWTGVVALCVELVEWSARALASGDGAVAIAEAAAKAPIPEWLAPWIDLSGWRAGLQAVAETLEWVSGFMPAAGQSLEWLVPVIWILWVLGLLVMLIAALIGARLVARR